MAHDGPPSPEQLSFGALLKHYRVAAGLSQEALAERARLSPGAISAYERGSRQAPYRDTVALLVAALGLSEREAAALEATVSRRRGPPDALPDGHAPLDGFEHQARGTFAVALPGQPFVYVSYARADRALVTRLAGDLHGLGVVTWNDDLGLQPGTPDWEQTLRDAIRAARAVLLVASPSSRASRYVADELRVAEMYRRPVYPIWAAGEQWMECVALGWGGMQYVDARGSRYGTALQDIAVALQRAGESVPAEHAAGDVSPDAAPRNPYKGLRAFQRADAGDFFGRESLVAELLAGLSAGIRAERRLLAVVGPSGSGKSSVVLAGLLPRLQRGAVPGSEQWTYLEPLVPGTHPLEALTVALSARCPAAARHPAH